MLRLENVDRLYGAIVPLGTPLPPTVTELQTLPPWTHRWAMRQLAGWVCRQGGRLDELLADVPAEYHDDVMAAWEEEIELSPSGG